MNFDNIYIKALKHVLDNGVEQLNGRTKAKILATHGYSFDYDMNILPLLYVRKVWAKSAAAELAWFLSGTRDATWVNEQTSIWKEFTDENDEIPTAYGYRWSRAFGYDQIDNIITKLSLDSTSRQQVLLSWDPRVDNREVALNIPCPLMYIINIIDNKLNIHLTLRSNDVWLGLPYDVMTACLLGKALANTLKVDLGKLHYSIAHMHLYENQLEAAGAAIGISKTFKKTSFPLVRNFSSYTIYGIRKHKDAYVESFNHLKDYNFSGWKPKVNVVR